jgi:hypothetical protein
LNLCFVLNTYASSYDELCDWRGCRYIRPQFFFNNPLLSFVQYVIGPYTDELGNVLPQAVAGVGVPVDPLAFAGLLGMYAGSLEIK